MSTPEELARANIGKPLSSCDRVIQDLAGINQYAELSMAASLDLESRQVDEF
jgi:hypothetical protein